MEGKGRLVKIIIAILMIISLFFVSKWDNIKNNNNNIFKNMFMSSAVNILTPGYEIINKPWQLESINWLDEIVGMFYPSGNYMKENYGVTYLSIEEGDSMEVDSTPRDIPVVNNIDNNVVVTQVNNNNQKNAITNTEIGINVGGIILSNGMNSSQIASEASPDLSTDSKTDMSVDSKNVENARKNLEGIIHRENITGETFSRQQLNDFSFIHDKFYTITSITSLTPEIMKPKEFLDYNLAVTHDNSTPQILIFHTHSQETFVDSVEGDASTSIVGVGDYLCELLTNRYGYNVIHDRTVYDLMDGKLDRSKAYTYSEEGIRRILEENPSIEVVIDLHRDGVPETTHLVTDIDGKRMAKVMFFNGLSYSNVNGEIDYLYNPYRNTNLSMSLQMHLLGLAYYPGFLRNIYLNAYRYCLHERGKSMLIEAGAQTNTVEEVKNAMEPLSDLLDKLLRGQKAY